MVIDGVKKRESADNKGITAEDLEGADEETTTMIHEVFNLIIKQDSMTHSSWKKVMITVIYKKGDPENCGPFRPHPQLYKLFSTMILNRLYVKLDSYQLHDKAGFRKKTRRRIIL